MTTTAAAPRSNATTNATPNTSAWATSSSASPADNSHAQPEAILVRIATALATRRSSAAA